MVFSNPAVPKRLWFRMPAVIVLEVQFLSIIPISKNIIDLFSFFKLIANSKTESYIVGV
jgi:hypothetical protein